MRKSLGKLGSILVIEVFLFGFGSGLVLAESSTFEVRFDFSAGDKVFPPGQYKITYARGNSNLFVLQNLGTNEKANVTFVTRLSRREKGAVIFDESDGRHYLSEVYMQGIDGFQLKGSPTDHKHVKVE